MAIGLMPRLHRTGRPSITAQAVTLWRALEHDRPEAERIVDDPYAAVFLGAAGRAARTGLRSPAVRPLRHAMERTAIGGVSTSVLCRHRFIDDHLLDELPGAEQVLVLGAGWDSRAYRFAAELGGRPVIEVDLPPLSRLKRRVVAAHPEVFAAGRVHSVEIDFNTQTLGDRLAGSPWRTGARTVVVWEGVAMYLDADAVRGTLTALQELCGRGSLLTMDAFQRLSGRRPVDNARRAGVRGLAVIGEPVTWAVTAERIGAVLGEAGFAVEDLATADVATARYATAGRRCDEGLYTLAARAR
ncbi:class I SAM-dependent methyltransferase [Jatrophihabitans fulvus]